MIAVVSLDKKSPGQATIGDFRWDSSLNLYAWKGKTAETLEELAEQVNEASEYLKKAHNRFLRLKVVTDPNAIPISQPPGVAAKPAAGAPKLRKLQPRVP